jgi:hypothetical protein
MVDSLDLEMLMSSYPMMPLYGMENRSLRDASAMNEAAWISELKTAGTELSLHPNCHSNFALAALVPDQAPITAMCFQKSAAVAQLDGPGSARLSSEVQWAWRMHHQCLRASPIRSPSALCGAKFEPIGATTRSLPARAVHFCGLPKSNVCLGSDIF